MKPTMRDFTLIKLYKYTFHVFDKCCFKEGHLKSRQLGCCTKQNKGKN